MSNTSYVALNHAVGHLPEAEVRVVDLVYGQHGSIADAAVEMAISYRDACRLLAHALIQIGTDLIAGAVRAH